MFTKYLDLFKNVNVHIQFPSVLNIYIGNVILTKVKIGKIYIFDIKVLFEPNLIIDNIVLLAKYVIMILHKMLSALIFEQPFSVDI